MLKHGEFRFLSRRNTASSQTKHLRPLKNPKHAGDFLTACIHAPILFELIIGEGNSKIPEKPERLGSANVQPAQAIASFGLFRAPLHPG